MRSNQEVLSFYLPQLLLSPRLIIPLTLIGVLLLARAVVLLPPQVSLALIGILGLGLVCIAVVHVLGTNALLQVLVLLTVSTLAWNDVRVTGSATVSDVFLVAALILAIGLRSSYSGNRSSYSWALSGLVLLITGGLLGTLVGQGEQGSLNALLRFSVASLGLLVLFKCWSPSRQQLDFVTWAWILSACISVAYAFTLEPDSRFLDRSAGLSVHPNHLALTSVLALGPAMAFIWKAGPWRFVALVAVLLLLSGIFYSGSRAAVIGAVSILAVISLTSKGLSLWSWLGVVGMVLAVAFGLGLLRPSLPEQSALGRILLPNDSTSESNQGRLERLSDSLRTVQANPLTGSGFENAREAHNIYIQVWSSAGLLGIVGFSIVAVSLVVRPIRYLWRRRGAEDLLLIGVVAGGVAYLVVGLLQPQIWDRYVWFALFLSAAVPGVAGPTSAVPTKPALSPESAACLLSSRRGSPLAPSNWRSPRLGDY